MSRWAAKAIERNRVLRRHDHELDDEAVGVSFADVVTEALSKTGMAERIAQNNPLLRHLAAKAPR